MILKSTLYGTESRIILIHHREMSAGMSRSAGDIDGMVEVQPTGERQREGTGQKL